MFPNFLPRKGVYGEILNVEFDADEPLETVDKVIVERSSRDDVGNRGGIFLGYLPSSRLTRHNTSGQVEPDVCSISCKFAN